MPLVPSANTKNLTLLLLGFLQAKTQLNFIGIESVAPEWPGGQTLRKTLHVCVCVWWGGWLMDQLNRLEKTGRDGLGEGNTERGR